MLLICCKVTTNLLEINVYCDLPNYILYEVDSCDSTQDAIVDLLGQHFGDMHRLFGIFTANQLSGKGQRGKTWYSNKGESLALTLALPIKSWMEQDLVLLNKSISVILCNNISRFINQPIRLKWPNDIVVADKKLGGILLHTHSSNVGKWLIFGLGLNVGKIPKEVENTAICLKDCCDHPPSIPVIAEQLLRDLSVFVKGTSSWMPSNFDSQYTEKLWKINSEVVIYFYVNEQLTKTELRTLIGVDAQGRIMLQSSTGHTDVFHHGEVRIAY